MLCLTLALPAFAQQNKSSVARGQAVFKAVNCVMCHESGGNMMDPAKPIKGSKFVLKYPTDESVAKRIREGSPNGVMPAFHKDQLPDKDLVDVIAYIRSLTPVIKCPSTGKWLPKPTASAPAAKAPQPAQKKGKS